MTTTRKRTLAIIALLVASVMFPAIQTYAAKSGGANKSLNRASNAGRNTRNMTRKNARPDGTADGPVANIDENWYLEFTPAYIKTGGALLDKFTGASIALGYRLTQEDKIQLEIGLFKSNNYSDIYTYTGNIDYMGQPVVPPSPIPIPITDTMPLTGNRAAKATAIPLLLSYSYCIQLDAPGRFEIRLTPVTGIIAMRDTWSIRNATGNYPVPLGTTNIDVSADPALTYDGVANTITKTESYNGSDSNKIAFALGGGFGFTCYFAPRWFADIGYRYLWTAKVSNSAPANGAPWNGVKAWNGMNAHVYSLSLGWKF